MSHYSNGYAVAIVQDGNVVETRMDSRVAIPFGSDYTIRLINRNTKRAVAKVSIDGQPVSGGGLIVNAYGSVDLERPTDKAVKFRFASTESNAAEEHGKAGPDQDGSKGLVSVEWIPEKEIQTYLNAMPQNQVSGSYTPRIENSSLKKRLRNTGPCGQSQSASGGEAGRHSTTMGFAPDYEKSQPTSGGIVFPTSSLSAAPSPELKSGVTVEGGYSSQSFRTVHFNPDYSAQVTITTIKLMGYTQEEGIPREGTRYCPACRTSTKKPTDKFCRQCGEKL